MAEPLFCTTGITSQTHDGYHVLFWDIDATPLHHIINDLTEVAKLHQLGDIVILESSPGSYHAICCDKRTLGQARDIINQSTLQDLNHTDYGHSLGRWVLRVTPKRAWNPDPPQSGMAALSSVPKLAHVIERPRFPHPTPYGVSRAHALYLFHTYGARQPLANIMDNGHALHVEHYLTTKA